MPNRLFFSDKWHVFSLWNYDSMARKSLENHSDNKYVSSSLSITLDTSIPQKNTSAYTNEQIANNE